MVNDIYKRFINKDATPAQYVWASRISILILAGFAAMTAFYIESIEKAWIYLIDLTAGMAVIWALRWYWWRVNAWAEITAMISSLLLANGRLILSGLHRIGILSISTYESFYVFYLEDYNMIRALFILVITSFVWVLVAYFTKPTQKEVLTEFYRNIQPSGWWGEIARENPDFKTKVTTRIRWIGWLLGIAFIYCSLIGIGYLVTARYLLGVVMILISLLSLYLLIKRFEINPAGL